MHDRKIHLGFLVVASLIFGFTIWFIAFYLPQTPGRVASFYGQHLKNLGNNVGSVASDLDENPQSKGIKTILATYNKELKAVAFECKQLSDKHQQINIKKYPDGIQKSVVGAQKLCDDLIPVISYSDDLYKALAPYLTYNTDGWPPYENDDFGSNLARTEGVIKSVTANVQRVNYPQIDDPALNELISQLKSADKLGEDAYNELTKNHQVQSQDLAEQLRKTMQQDKADFLNARLYFWQNTVQADALEKAISHLQEQVKS